MSEAARLLELKLMRGGTHRARNRVRGALAANRAGILALNPPGGIAGIGAAIGGALGAHAGAAAGFAAGEAAGWASLPLRIAATRKLVQHGNRRKKVLRYLNSRAQGQQLPHRGQFGGGDSRIKITGPRSAMAALDANRRRERVAGAMRAAFPKPLRQGRYT